MSSGTRVNYAIRPAKNIERKMLTEAFRRLYPFGLLSSYRYIGFGSFYFSDFTLFHKALGIRDATSIELDIKHKARYKFNLPFKCVKLIFDHSSSALPSLDWKKRTILWLDYDLPLQREMLGDIQHFAANASSGSVVVVTVDADAGRWDSDRLAMMEENIGEDKVPFDVLKDLGGWGLAREYQKVINNEILEVLSHRNGGLPPETKYHYEQLFHFRYADGANMVTVGGVLYAHNETKKFRAVDVSDLDFIRSAQEPYYIAPPKLTLREIRNLDKQLPKHAHKKISAPGIPPEEVQEYAKVYRYFPAFVDAEI